MPDQFRVLRLYAETSPFESPVILVGLLLSMGMAVVVGLGGLQALRSARPVPPALEVPSSTPPA
jgi:hypothetical protein